MEGMETNTAEVQPWWHQGNLHDKTLADWRVAEENNRLASSLDMLIAMQQDLGAALEYSNGEELMRYVFEMVGCMDALASSVPQPAEISVANAALTSAQALGYLPGSGEAEASLSQRDENRGDR